MHALILVDETGKFSPEESSHVGACLVSMDAKELVARLASACAGILQAHPVKGLPKYPKCLHLAPLTNVAARESHEEFKNDPREGTAFARAVLERFRDDIELYRSKGSARVFVHEQQHYLEHLMTVLCGLFQERDWSACDGITVQVGSRRTPSLLGDWGIQHREELERELANALKQKLEKLAGLAPGMLRVEVGKYIDDGFHGLGLADLALGAATRKHGPLAGLVKPKAEYDIVDYRMIVEGSEVAVFDRDVKEDAPAALFRLLRYACSLGEGGRRSGLLARLARSCVSGLDGQAAGERFLALVDSWLDEVRRNRAVDPGAWQRVPVLREALCLVREALPAGGRLARHLELCSIHLRVELAAHGIFPLGEDEEGAIVARAEEIFDSPDLFDDVLGGFMARIEYMLMLVQHVHFNRIRFEGVEECLAPLERTHHDLLAHLQGSGFAGVRRLDALRGQLLGTLAQARAFLGCRPGCESLQRTALFTKAWELFEESLRHFPEGTRFWSQGNNYLVCLFWRFGYFNEALELHFRKADKPELRLLLSLGSKALGNVQEGSVRDWFICLNHLRLLATACRERMLGDPVRGADLSILVNEILAHEDSLRSVDGGYPFNLVLKWLAVIALQAPTLAPGATRGEIARLLELAVAEARGEPVLEAMRQVELLVLAVLRQEAGAREDLLDLDGLRAAVPEGWLDLSENLFGLAPAEVAWKVANGLPFYYA